MLQDAAAVGKGLRFQISVADLFHFDSDPDPALDLPKIKKKQLKKNFFLKEIYFSKNDLFCYLWAYYLQVDQLNMAVFFWYLGKSDLLSVTCAVAYTR